MQSPDYTAKPPMRESSANSTGIAFFDQSGASPPRRVSRKELSTAHVVILTALDERPSFVKDVILATGLHEEVAVRTVIDLIVGARVRLTPHGLAVKGGAR